MERYVDNVDPNILDALTHKWAQRNHPAHQRDMICVCVFRFLEKSPNTYGFTKRLAEDLVYKYNGRLPIAVGRPSISIIHDIWMTSMNVSAILLLISYCQTVVLCWKEPLKSYTEGLHGPNGFTIAAGRGALRSMYIGAHLPCHVIQCDVVVNGLAVLAYERSKKR